MMSAQTVHMAFYSRPKASFPIVHCASIRLYDISQDRKLYQRKQQCGDLVLCIRAWRWQSTFPFISLRWLPVPALSLTAAYSVLLIITSTKEVVFIGVIVCSQDYAKTIQTIFTKFCRKGGTWTAIWHRHQWYFCIRNGYEQFRIYGHILAAAGEGGRAYKGP